MEVLTTAEQKDAITAYQTAAAQKSERERQGAGDHEIRGCFTGGYAVHPLTGEKITVWIADYV